MLSDNDYLSFFEFVAKDHVGTNLYQEGITTEVLEDVLRVQRQLVVVFNEHLDRGFGGRITLAHFTEACMKNAAVAELFAKGSINASSKVEIANLWRNRMLPAYSYEGMSFADVHRFLHKPDGIPGYNELKQRLNRIA